ncbi:ORF69 [Ranid herpesvirus 2]|uniref:ORF69 n=1 Tax=Ranid herpesvirus 2 TaxID=389214 RepID=Q14W37_9VIRU|nr:ORF69 [Ranid herpesvirus 2]ABG25666.1 ORF69 [Ranid herpesvirus 2]
MCDLHKKAADRVRQIFEGPMPADTLHVYLHRCYLTAFAYYYRFYRHEMLSHNTRLFNESMRQEVEKICTAWNSPIQLQLTAHACAATMMFYVTPNDIENILMGSLPVPHWNHDLQLAAFSAASMSYNSLCNVETLLRFTCPDDLCGLTLALELTVCHLAPTPSLARCCPQGMALYSLKRYLSGDDDVMGAYDKDLVWELLACSFGVLNLKNLRSLRKNVRPPLPPMEQAFPNLYARLSEAERRA